MSHLDLRVLEHADALHAESLHHTLGGHVEDGRDRPDLLLPGAGDTFRQGVEPGEAERITSGSAFIAANGSRSPSRHLRISSRSVRSSAKGALIRSK